MWHRKLPCLFQETEVLLSEIQKLFAWDLLYPIVMNFWHDNLPTVTVKKLPKQAPVKNPIICTKVFNVER